MADGDGPETHERSASITSRAEISDEIETRIRRGLNPDRLTLLSVLVGIALTVAFGVESASWLWRVGIGVAAFFGLAAVLHVLLRFEPTRHAIMAFGHWVSGNQA